MNLTSTAFASIKFKNPLSINYITKVKVPDKIHYRYPACVLMHSRYKTYLNACVLSQSLSISNALLDINQQRFRSPYPYKWELLNERKKMVPLVGLEPTASSLQMRRSAYWN